MALFEKKPKEPKVYHTPTKYEETANIDYSTYYMTKQEIILYTVMGCAVLFALGYIFYRSVIVAALFALLGFKYPEIKTKSIISDRQKKISNQFKDMLYAMQSAVSSGVSVENSVTMALEEMKKQYVDPTTIIIRELELMVNRISVGTNIEEVFADFAARTHNEDVFTFSNIFEISKRTGGNIVEIMRQTATIISEKIEVKGEIDTRLSGKKAEGKVMIAMPILLIFFMSKTTGDFMEPVFTTLYGRAAATVALAPVIVGALWLNKITDIEV